MILNTDLKNTYHFNVITVRPKDLLTTQYIMIPYSIEEEFLKEFGKYCKRKNYILNDEDYKNLHRFAHEFCFEWILLSRKKWKGFNS